MRVILQTERLTLRQFTEDGAENPYDGPDIIEGSEHGEVEYALTKPEWEARRSVDA